MKKNGFTLIELLVVIAIVSILFVMVAGGIGGCSVSDGSRVGTITKFSHKGVIWKTYEGEMNCGGMRSGTNGEGISTLATNIWEFSVEKNNKKIIDEIQSAMDENYPVKLTYRQKFLVMPWTADTTYFITEVKTIKKE